MSDAPPATTPAYDLQVRLEILPGQVALLSVDGLHRLMFSVAELDALRRALFSAGQAAE